MRHLRGKTRDHQTRGRFSLSHCGENFVFYVGYIVGVVYYVVYTLYLGKNPIVNLRLEIRKLLLLKKRYYVVSANYKTAKKSYYQHRQRRVKSA